MKSATENETKKVECYCGKDVYQDIVTPEFEDFEKYYFIAQKHFLKKKSHIKRAWNYAKNLKLNELKGKSILDIGTGFGYFPKVCDLLGHHAEGTTLGRLIPDAIAEKMGVKLHFADIKDKIELAGRYDMITSFQLCFHKHGGREWSPEEWKVFIDSALKMLRRNGLLVLQVNRPNSLKDAALGYKNEVSRVIKIWK